MYRSKLNSYIFTEITATIIYVVLLFVLHNVFALNIALKIAYEAFIVSEIIMAKIYMDYHNNVYIEKNYPELFQKYKSRLYDYRRNLLSFEIYLDIKKNTIQTEKNDELYNIAKEGLHFLIFVCINFLIMGINFIFITIPIIFG